MNPADFSVMPSALHQLQQEIADESSVFLIERYARRGPKDSRGLWDVSSPDPDEVRDESLRQMDQDLLRAARYLELRGLLTRPVPGYPHLVRIVQVAA